MLLVLYSANLNMWLNDIPFNGHVMRTGEHVVRALMQLFSDHGRTVVVRPAPTKIGCE